MRTYASRKRIAIVNCSTLKGSCVFGRKTGLNNSTLSRTIITETNRKGRMFNIDVFAPLEDGKLPDPKGYDAIIIPGSLYTPTKWQVKKYDWMKKLLEVIRNAHHHGRFVFGICFGHQMIAAAFGVKAVLLDKEERTWELGFEKVNMAEGTVGDPLFRDIGYRFAVAEAHGFVVPRLPKGVVLTIWNERCVIQGFRIGKNIMGVQFHPDYDPINMKILVKELGYIFPKNVERGVNLDADNTQNFRVYTNFLEIVNNS